MTTASPAASAVADLAGDHHIVVCCGSGGVGKTTTAAALAVEGARRGRNTVVVTVDPARRLANALGLDSLTHTASEVDHQLWDPDGDAAGGGSLWALMLDSKSTFDELVLKYAADTDQGERILENRFYRNVSTALSGTQEYMATEKLHELHEAGTWDLIVVDTPPTRHALDFIEAPARLTRLLDNRLFRLVMAPTRASFKVANLALVTFFRTVAKVIGSEVVDDLVAFFQAFEGMEDGFRRRARKVTELLADPRTAFVLITSPGRDAISEAGYFSRRLREVGLGVDGLVVNRIHPRFGDETPEDLRARALVLAGTAAPGELADGPAGLARLFENLADFSELAGRERRHLAGLEQHVGDVPIVRVPLLPTEVCDFSGLLAVGRHLLAPVAETDPEGGSG